MSHPSVILVLVFGLTVNGIEYTHPTLTPLKPDICVGCHANKKYVYLIAIINYPPRYS
jgi:hypothetical protein